VAGTSTVLTEIYRDFPYLSGIDKFLGAQDEQNSVGPKCCGLFRTGFSSSDRFLSSC
jgi:hypothetical protein